MLRGVVLNLLVWLPILVWLMITLLALSPVFGGELTPAGGAPAVFTGFLGMALGLGALFLVGCLANSFSTYSPRTPHAER